MKLIFVFALFFLLLATSCTRTVVCPPGGVNISFAGFDTTNLDTIIINTYSPIGNFSELLSSHTIQVQYEAYPYMGDNGYSYIVYNQSPFTRFHGYITTGIDYEIITSNHTYKITGVNYKQRIITKSFDVGCKREFDDFSPINSYYLDGVFKMNNEENLIYLEK
jgi:hypothetical protein